MMSLIAVILLKVLIGVVLVVLVVNVLHVLLIGTIHVVKAFLQMIIDLLTMLQQWLRT